MPYIGNTPADKFLTLAKQSFSTSATTSYTLDSAVSSTQDIALFINNVRQSPVDAYTVSGTSLTLTSATAGTDEMYCVYLGKTVGTSSPATNSIATAMLQANAVTGAKLNTDVISAQTALGATPADTDELLVSDAGTIKRVDYSYIKGELNSPAFNVFQSSSASISNASYTVLSLDGNTYNPDSKFASNKFTPAVSGLYYLEAKIRYNTTSTFTALQVVIRKNGSALVRGTNNNTNYSTATVSALIQSDTDDYFDVEAYQNSGGSLDLINNAESTYFLGFRVIST